MLKRRIEQDLRNKKNFGARNGKFFWEETPWWRIREQNSVYKEFLETVGNGKPTGNVRKETTAVSATMSISVEKWHHQNPSPNSLMRQNERKPSRTQSPRGKSPVVECLDGPASIASKELAPIHFVKNGIHQNACSTCPREVAELENSALTRIARLKNSLGKDPQKIGDQCAVAMLNKNDSHESVWQPFVNRDESHERSERPDINRDACHELKQGPVGRRSSSARHLGCVFLDMTPPKSLLRKSTDMQKPIQHVKFTKASARHTDSRPTPFARIFFAQVNLISAAPTLQNLRIGLKRRQSGKSKVPAKQRGSGQKCFKIQGAWKNNILDACLHQILNLRKENLLLTPARQCIWSAKKTWLMRKWILWRNRVVLR